MQLLGAKSDGCWTPVCTAALNTLLAKAATKFALGFADYGQPITLHVDCDEPCVGDSHEATLYCSVVLSQGAKDAYTVLAMGGRPMTPTEVALPLPERLLLVALWGI